MLKLMDFHCFFEIYFWMPSLIYLAHEILILFSNYFSHIIRPVPNYAVVIYAFYSLFWGLFLAHTVIYVLM